MERVGLDIGTKNIILAYHDNKEIKYKHEVNGFIELEKTAFTKSMLNDSNVPFVEINEKIYALGKKAEEIAYTFGKSLSRPMADGVLSIEEHKAMQIMSIIIRELISNIKDKAILYYCIPGPAINRDTNVEFHNKIIQLIFEAIGKNVVRESINEARALVIGNIPDKTGVGISCLLPGNKIITKEGLLNIEDITTKNKVLSSNGEFNGVYKITKSKRNEKVLYLKFNGSSFGCSLTKDHKALVYGDNGWEYKYSEDLIVGDIVGEPIVSRHQKKNHISFKDHIGNNTKFNRVIEFSKTVARFIGYFLSNGHIHLQDNGCECIGFDFGPEEFDLEKDMREICNNKFGRTLNQINKDSKNNIHYNALAKWLNKHCYDSKRLKKLPFDIATLSIPSIEGLITGLMKSDGWDTGNQLEFENKSHNLVLNLHLMLGMLGINSSISYRKPCTSSYIDDRKVHGTGSYVLSITGHDNVTAARGIIENNNSKSPSFFNIGGYRCTRIRAIEEKQYDGPVYDISVKNDPSFALPYLTVHNCGAGMVNISYCLFGMSIYDFSLVGCGDWIDYETARVTGHLKDGRVPAHITKTKENMKLGTTPPEDYIEQALYLNYKILIEKVAKGIIAGFNKNETEARASKPMPIIIGGGTASPPGFIDLFKQVFDTLKMPFEVGDIKLAKDPLYAVARGCLVTAKMHE